MRDKCGKCERCGKIDKLSDGFCDTCIGYVIRKFFKILDDGLTKNEARFALDYFELWFYNECYKYISFKEDENA